MKFPTPIATAAPTEIRLAGNPYRLSPLTQGMKGAFMRWMQKRAIDIARENLEGLTTEQQAAILKAAYEKAHRLTMTTPEGLEVMVSPEGSAFLLYLLMRPNHPSITPEAVEEMLMDPKTLEEAQQQMTAATALDTPEGLEAKKKLAEMQTAETTG